MELYSDEAQDLLRLAQWREGGPRNLLSWWLQRKRNGECRALRGTHCTIYDRRPQECRHFGPEHPKCPHHQEPPPES